MGVTDPSQGAALAAERRCTTPAGAGARLQAVDPPPRTRCSATPAAPPRAAIRADPRRREGMAARDAGGRRPAATCDNAATDEVICVATTVPKRRKDKSEEWDVPEPRMLTREESHALFDSAARYYLGMSGEEFIRAWDAGEFPGDPDDRPELMHLVMLLPFGR
jgi:hypothetical protein